MASSRTASLGQVKIAASEMLINRMNIGVRNLSFEIDFAYY
jgi:hypothetical protein